MVATGILSVFMYAVLFAKQELINDHFARGGLYAFLPILAAFLFSLVHGSFTGHFWSVLGMHPKQKREGK